MVDDGEIHWGKGADEGWVRGIGVLSFAGDRGNGGGGMVEKVVLHSRADRAMMS
jgi:hypothetical protein